MVNGGSPLPPPFCTGDTLGEMPEESAVRTLGLPVMEEEAGTGAMPVISSGGEAAGKGELPVASSASSSRKTEDTTQTFTLGEGLPPVPAKLGARIQRGEFVDMAELLRDNIEAERRKASQDQGNSGGSNPRRREVPDLLSWIQCFGVYTCVVCEKSPERLRQLLAYQTMLVREARRCGGGGWQAYDTMFRQHAASTPTDWSKINGSLFAVTFLTQQSGKGRSCRHCLESDHGAADCALAPVGGKSDDQGDKSRNRRDIRRPYPSRGAAQRAVCYNWNDGIPCSYGEECIFLHECEECGGSHRRSECPEPNPRRPLRKRPRTASYPQGRQPQREQQPRPS